MRNFAGPQLLRFGNGWKMTCYTWHKTYDTWQVVSKCIIYPPCQYKIIWLVSMFSIIRKSTYFLLKLELHCKLQCNLPPFQKYLKHQWIKAKYLLSSSTQQRKNSTVCEWLWRKYTCSLRNSVTTLFVPKWPFVQLAALHKCREQWRIAIFCGGTPQQTTWFAPGILWSAICTSASDTSKLLLDLTPQYDNINEF